MRRSCQRLPSQAHPLICVFNHCPQPIGKPQPGQSAEQAEPGSDQRQQQQRRAGKTEQARQRIAGQRTEHPAGSQRQRNLQRVQADRFERAAGQQQRRKPRCRNPPCPLVEDAAGAQIAVPRPHALQQEQHPPPRGKTEQVKQQVGEICAHHPARIARQRAAGAMRPGRVGAVVAMQRQRDIQRACDQQQPARLAQQVEQFAAGQGAIRFSHGTHRSARVFRPCAPLPCGCSRATSDRPPLCEP